MEAASKSHEDTDFSPDTASLPAPNSRAAQPKHTGLATMPAPPRSPGTYALILAADRHQKSSIGRLGTLVVQPGFYAYVGSALGPGGLAARIARHLRNEKKHHWHIHYLRVLKTLVEVQHACDAGHLSLEDAGKVAGFSEDTRQQIAEQLREQGLENAKTIYESHRPSKAATRRGAKSIWFNLRHALVEAVKELPGNVGNIGWMDREDLELVEQAEVLLDEVKGHIGKYLEDEEDEIDGPDIGGFVHGLRIPDVLGHERVDMMSTGCNDRGVDTVSTATVRRPDPR